MTVDSVVIDGQVMPCTVSELCVHGSVWWKGRVLLPDGRIIPGAAHPVPGAARTSAWHAAKRVYQSTCRPAR